MQTKDAACIGHKFGRLTALSIDKDRTRGPRVRIQILCRCDCGAERLVSGTQLRNGSIVSCGCLRNEKVAAAGRENRIHGHSKVGDDRNGTPTYCSWRAMIDRCTRPRATNYARYGGRGIAVCEHWLEFPGFLADMGIRPAGTTLDRIDGTGNYEPGNVRWADSKQQNRNRVNVYLDLDRANEVLGRREHGESRASVARRMGITKETVRAVERGHSWRELPRFAGEPCRS